MPRLGRTDLDVFPLCLGGNVFGWTADERQSHAVLDAYTDAGGNFVDTADVYSAWADGNSGGESEEIIGRWMAGRGSRDDVVVATKVGRKPGSKGLSAEVVARAAEDSLRRLGTDRIDLYYSHADDPGTPLEETVAAFGSLVTAGKVRHLGLSNYTPQRTEEILKVAEAAGVEFVAHQPLYNLVERPAFEDGLAEVADRAGLAVVPYAALAGGFLTGKYRSEDHGNGDRADRSPRAGRAARYLDDRGRRLLGTLDRIASAHSAAVTTVSLAWLASRPTVAAPIASARSVQQLPDLVAVADLRLTADDLAELDRASAAG